MVSGEVAQIGDQGKTGRVETTAATITTADNNASKRKYPAGYKLRRVFVAEWDGARRNSKDRPELMRGGPLPPPLPRDMPPVARAGRPPGDGVAGRAAGPH